MNDRLSEFLEGDLPPGERREVADHLEVCGSCRRERDLLEEMVREAGGLDRGVSPSRDLWPGIRERLTPRVVTSPARSPRRGWWPAAAVAALAVLFSWGVLRLPAGDPPSADPPWSVSYLDRAYGDLTRRLESEIRDRGSIFPEGTRADLSRDLDAFDRAIARSRDALSEHPRSRELRLVLSNTYQRKVELLQWAVRLAAEFNRG